MNKTVEFEIGTNALKIKSITDGDRVSIEIYKNNTLTDKRVWIIGDFDEDDRVAETLQADIYDESETNDNYYPCIGVSWGMYEDMSIDPDTEWKGFNVLWEVDKNTGIIRHEVESIVTNAEMTAEFHYDVERNMPSWFSQAELDIWNKECHGFTEPEHKYSL